MWWLNVITGIAGVIIGFIGLFGYQKVNKSKKINNKKTQKNRFGDNIINEGFSAEDVQTLVTNIHKMKDENLREIIKVINNEKQRRPQLFIDKEEPQDAVDGDLWFKIIDGIESERVVD